MTEQVQSQAFADAKTEVTSMPEALMRAKDALGMINPAPVDSVRSCRREDDGKWRVVLDVIESPARMGDNDLMSSYELVLAANGDIEDFERTDRFHREDLAAS